MATPNLKILVNALRLGQPQDPKAVAFVLAEAITAQDETIEELRRKLAMTQQLTQILEARANRLEAELDAMRAVLGGHAHQAAAYQPPPSTRMHDHAPASHAPPPSHRPPSQPPPVHRSAPPPAGQPGSVPPPADGPSALRIPVHTAVPEIHAAIPDSDSFEESVDDFKTATVVVRQRDVLAAHLPEAPFQITPAGARVQPHASIPGAPWARERGHQVPVPMDDYTVDAFERGISSEDLEGETYHNQEGQNALRDLGIAGAHPSQSSGNRPRTTPRIPDDENPRDRVPPRKR